MRPLYGKSVDLLFYIMITIIIIKMMIIIIIIMMMIITLFDSTVSLPDNFPLVSTRMEHEKLNISISYFPLLQV